MSEEDYNAGWAHARIYYDPEYDDSMGETAPPEQWSYAKTQKPLRALMSDPTTTASRALHALREMAITRNLGELSMNELHQFFSWFRSLNREASAGHLPTEWVRDSTPEVERLKAQNELLRKRLVAYGEFKRAINVERNKLEKVLE